MDKVNMGIFSKQWIKANFTMLASYGGLFFCIIFFSILTPVYGDSIWSANKISTLITDVIVMGLITVGAIFVYSMGCMDISLGKQVGLYATLMVLLGNSTGSLVWGTLLALVIAVVIAVVNGAAGELLNIPSVVSSLVFMMVLGGVSSITYTSLGTRNAVLREIDTSCFKSTAVMVVVLVIETLIVTYLYNYTKLGKNAKAIGANPIAAKQNGINIVKYKVLSYIVLGVCVVVASLFQMGYTGTSSDATGTGFEMNVLVALILGGMPLSGGMRSKVSCAVIGSFTYSLLNVGLPIIGVEANQVFLIKAIIFIAIVLITCRQKDGVLPR